MSSDCSLDQEREIQLSARITTLRNLLKIYSRVGILTHYPSSTPLGFPLGPPNPWLITIAKETLNFRCAELSSALRLLRPTFSLLSAPPLVTRRLQCTKNASLPRNHTSLRSGGISKSKFLISK